jgi:hypothetical protein
MGRIYSSARCDLLWLGEDTGLDEDVASVLERESLKSTHMASANFLMDGLLRLPEFDTRVPNQLKKVFDVPIVWSRIWIVQEVAAARDVQVLYGKRKFFWQTLRYVCYGIAELHLSHLWSRTGDFFSQGFSHASDLLNFRQLTRVGFTIPLSEIWERFGAFGATDPRDRVFGILGFLQEDLGVQLDYTKSPEEIFSEVTRRYISTTGDLNVLILDILYVGTGEYSLRVLPSWVPKFGTNEEIVKNLTLWKFFSAGNRRVGSSMLRELEVEQDPQDYNILNVEGILLDALGPLISSKPLQFWLLEDFVENFQKAQRLARHEYCSDDESLDIYWRTLSLDVVSRSQSEGELMDVDADAHRRIVKDALLEPDNKEEDRQKAAQQLLLYTSSFTRGYCLTITQGGFSVMVPPSAKEGDVILVLFGTSAPWVARAISELGDGDALPKRYRLIGPAYVHGFMDGEAIGMLDKGLSKRVFELV